MRNSSQTHCTRSTRRQRTTPWIAGIGPALYRLNQRLALRRVQLRDLAQCLPVNHALWTARVETQDPIAHRLKANAADPGRVTVLDLGKSQ